MRLHTLGMLGGLCLCGTFVVACSPGGGASAPQLGGASAVGAPGAVPLAGHTMRGVGRAGARVTRNVLTCSGSGSFSFVGGQDANVAAGTDTGVLSGGQNQACDQSSAIGAGGANAISSGANSAYESFIAAGFENIETGNAADSFIGAGGQNSIMGFGYNSFIGSGVTNVITGSSEDSAIAAGQNNTINVAAQWGFIGAGIHNTVSGQQGFIGGGAYNATSSPIAVIVDGSYNIVSGEYGFIGNGYKNNVSGYFGVIGGGDGNKVQASNATVAGGISNQALGLDASVPGGDGNIASGAVSFAAGTASFAAHSGAFVWSDNASGAYQLKSSGANQFLARASGGVVFYTNPTLTTGAILHAGSGTWASASDRALKTNVEPIDDTAILDRVAAMPISKWSYISEHGVRHVGPMAQDFYAAFGVGADNKHITSIDEDGVALAAIKALHRENAELRVQLASAKTQAVRKDAAMQREIQQLAATLKTMRPR